MAAISEGRSWADAILGVSSAERSSHWRSKALFTAGLLAWGAGELGKRARLLAKGVGLDVTLDSYERLA